MERVLRESKISEVREAFETSFDLSSGLVYYPVRHHSPACSLHLQKLLEEYQPDGILIEGPPDGEHLIPYMADENSKAPFCIYYSYDDKKGIVTEGCKKYRAYYPFLEYSPEYVALCEAVKKKIGVHFIDLPYGSRLVNEIEMVKAQRSFLENEEYELNVYTHALAEKAGCRSFSEFWESHFELVAEDRVTRDFAYHVFSLGYFMRLATEEKDMQMDLWRENFMMNRIVEAQKKYKKIVVLAGAFHIMGLLNPIKETKILKEYEEEAVAVYLMPYTFQELDSKNGYSAGMPFPAFYQSIWQKMNKKKEETFESVVLDYIIKTARYARKTQMISIPDEINANNMAIMLAKLRGKVAPGVYDLIDAVRSSFVKGDITSTATFEWDFLFHMLSGLGAGSVVANEYIPPVVVQFRSHCARYRIKTSTVAMQKLTLDIVKNRAHYEKSRFLHQLEFLETGFCKMESGPDYVNKKNKNLVRELWTLHYHIQVETRLIDLSVYGSTLSQICAYQIQQSFTDHLTAEELGKLLLSVQIMGVEHFYEQYGDNVLEIVERDTNFISICKFLERLRYLMGMQELLQGKVLDFIQKLMKKAFTLVVNLLEYAKGVSEGEEQNVCEQIKNLYALTVEKSDYCGKELLDSQIEIILEDGFCNSRVYGSCLAIYYKQGKISMEEYCERIHTYLHTAIAAPEEAASFVCGIFLTGRDALFTDVAILEQIDDMISSMDSETFLIVLPNLRFAFTSFLPIELDRIAKMIGERYDISDEKLKGSNIITQEELKIGMQLDEKAVEQMKKWGLHSG